MVSKDGITVDLEKIRAIMERETPRNADEVRPFMGSASYYKLFIENFSQISYPITHLQLKGKKFELIEECATIFEQLNNFLTNSPFLKIANPNKELMVCLDAFKEGLGGDLIHEG